MKINGSNKNNFIGDVKTQVKTTKEKVLEFFTSKNPRTQEGKTENHPVKNIGSSKNLVKKNAPSANEPHEEPLAPESKTSNSFKSILSKVISKLIGLFRPTQEQKILKQKNKCENELQKAEEKYNNIKTNLGNCNDRIAKLKLDNSPKGKSELLVAKNTQIIYGKAVDSASAEVDACRAKLQELESELQHLKN